MVRRLLGWSRCATRATCSLIQPQPEPGGSPGGSSLAMMVVPGGGGCRSCWVVVVTPALSFRPRQPRLWCRAGRALLRRAWLSCWVSWVSACPATAHASSRCTTSPQITSLDEMDGEHTDFSFFFWEIRLLNVDSSKFVFVVKKQSNTSKPHSDLYTFQFCEV